MTPHRQPRRPRRHAPARGQLDRRLVPSILGYIAIATAGNEALRGRAASRFEARHAGRPRRRASSSRRTLFELLGTGRVPAQRRVLRRLARDLLLRRQGPERPKRDGGQPRDRTPVSLKRYLELVGHSHVWLLAPTWIAVNAAIGLWFSQSLFQFSEGRPAVPGPVAAPGLRRQPDHGRRDRDRDHLRRRASSGGATASTASGGRRSSSSACSAGIALVGAGVVVNHAAYRRGSTHRCRRPRRRGRASSSAPACSSSPARRRRRSACSPTSPSSSPAIAARSWACTRCSSASARSAARCSAASPPSGAAWTACMVGTAAILLVAAPVPLGRSGGLEHYLDRAPADARRRSA